MTKGTAGYETAIPHFIEISRSLDFAQVCKDFIPFLPSPPATVLDAGCGAGQNSAALAALEFKVIALEPMQAFLDAAKNTYTTQHITWCKDSLPQLACLTEPDTFDFVLIDAVWHHLNEWEREQAILRLSGLIKLGGKCAISLRNGPAGLGTRIFPTNAETTIKQFENHGFGCIFSTNNQASLLPNKAKVKWARLVFQKKAR